MLSPERERILLKEAEDWDDPDEKKDFSWDEILKELDKKHVGDIKAKEVTFLCAIGRLVKNKKPYSFNCLVLAPSSAGKDHLVGSVLKLFPTEEIETFGRISPKSLNYLHTLEDEPDYSYDGKIIYLKEIGEEVLNNEVMKEFTSGEEEISKVAITKQKGMGIDIKEIRGHPEVFATTATTIPTEETRNRFNIVGMDLSDEQIKRSFIKTEEEYGAEAKRFIANLKPRTIKIPKKLFDFIKETFPSNKQRHKRDFQKLLDFVKVLALFNGKKIADNDDYDKARDIYMNAYSTCADIPLKDIDKRIVKVIENSKDPLSAKCILNELGGVITIQNLYPHLRNLVVKEILDKLTDRIGGYVIQHYVLSEEYINKKPFILPKSLS